MTSLAGRIRAIPSWQITLGVALLALGFLIAAQMAAEGPRVRYTSQERTPLVATALDLQAQQDHLKQQVLDARDAIGQLEAAGEGGAAVTVQLNDQLEAARMAAGLVALTGPGIVIQLVDSSLPVPADGNARDRSEESLPPHAPRGQVHQDEHDHQPKPREVGAADVVAHLGQVDTVDDDDDGDE